MFNLLLFLAISCIQEKTKSSYYKDIECFYHHLDASQLKNPDLTGDGYAYQISFDSTNRDPDSENCIEGWDDYGSGRKCYKPIKEYLTENDIIHSFTLDRLGSEDLICFVKERDEL